MVHYCGPVGLPLRGVSLTIFLCRLRFVFLSVILDFCFSIWPIGPGELSAQQLADPAMSQKAPGLEQEQPTRRNLRNPYGAGDNDNLLPPPGREPRADSARADQNGQQAAPEIEPSVPIPPFPNYPESNLPRPPRPPKQQEYLYLNHLYFEPLTLAVGGFFSFGWLGMISAGNALRLGLDLYNAGTNLSVVIQGQQDNPDYQITAILLRLGIHFFLEPTQLKGFEVGLDLRSGLAILPASGNAVVVQASVELPFTYRFVFSFYARSGRQALNLGIAPYAALTIGGFLATSNSVSYLLDSDSGFYEYMNNGNLFFEPGFINEIEPIALKVAIRLGFDVSLVF